MAHITFLIPSLSGGGAQRTVLKAARGLAEREHRVDIVLFAPSVSYPDEVPERVRLLVLCNRTQWANCPATDRSAGAQWRSERVRPVQLAHLSALLLREFRTRAPILLRRAAFGRALRLTRYIERERPDILLANLPPAEYAAFFARRLTRPCAFPPIVPIVRDMAKPSAKHTRRRRMLFPEAAHVVAVSRGVARSVTASVGVPADKVTPIYNPVFTPDIVLRAAAQPDHPWFGRGEPPIILGAGRLAEQKDFQTLIEAFRRVSEKRPCRLIILGEGPKRGELEDCVRRLGLEDRISLPGWVKNPYAFMSRAALFVLSSRHEGFPGALVEALACGCPVASTDCPAGPAEILEDSSLLAPVGNPEALAQAILRTLDRPADKAALRARAARFSMERAIEEYEELISRILARRAAERQA